jgi:hypothetical protein
MSIGLQEGIDFANSRNSEVQVVISMHEASGLVLFGVATPTVRPDVPLRNGPATIGAPGGFRRLRLVPGFSTRGNPPFGPNLQRNQFVASDRTAPAPPVQTQRFIFDQPIHIDFSVRRDPGSAILRWFGGGPSIQIEIETLSAPGGTVINGVMLNAVEDGVLLRAVGASVQNPGLTASYTVTLDVAPILDIP